MSFEFKEKGVGDDVIHFVHVPEAMGKLPIFLLHGADPQFNGWQVWKHNMEALARCLHPHALDLVGYGKSRSKHSNTKRPGTSEQAKIVMELIKSLSVEHFALGGLSWGAAVVNELIKSEESRVRLLLLVSPAVLPDRLAVPLTRGDIPTIIVACPQDPVVSIHRSKLLYENIPKSIFITIDAPLGTQPMARAHHIQSLCPEEFNEKVHSVLKSITC